MKKLYLYSPHLKFPVQRAPRAGSIPQRDGTYLPPDSDKARSGPFHKKCLCLLKSAAFSFAGGITAASLCCVFPMTTSAESRATSDENTRKVVVSAHHFETPAEKVGSSVTVITAEDIERSQKVYLLDLLRDVPGVDVVQSGGRGGNASVFLRGANSEHTLVVLDGIEINNPGSNARFFNFANMSLENIEQVEILRGSQSTLYGSDAIGGVIHITTKKGTPQTEIGVSVEGGSFETFVESAEVRSGAEGGEFSFGVSREDSGSFSAAAEEDGNSEDDEYERTSFSFQGGIHPLNELDLNVVFRHNDSKADIDNDGGVGGDDPNRLLDTRETFFRTEAALDLFDGALKQVYGVSLTNHKFNDDNDPDAAHPLDTQRSQYRGKLIKWDLKNVIHPTESSRLVFGIETEQEKASSNFSSDGAFGPYSSNFGPTDARTNGYYADLFVEATEWLASSFGVRVDDHSRTDSEVTFRVAPVVTIAETGTRFLGTVSTGYKSPSLFQLYSSFGNPMLEAEESTSWELGIEQTLFGDAVTVGGTYFRNDIDQLVTFNSGTFLFENINEAEIEGFEFFARANLVEGLDLSIDFTLLDTEDKSTGDDLLRRARSQVSSSLHYTFLDARASVQARVRYVGDRDDQNFNTFPAERVELSGYTLVDLLGSYQVSDEISLFARVENLFDKEYQEVFGYGTAGVAAYGGVKVNI